jgi:hypothetical protein
MTDYIPTTEVVQARYHLAGVSDKAPQFLIDAGRHVCNAEFDRWLRKVKADAYDEGFDQGHYVNDSEDRDCGCRENPYRD